MSSEPDTFDLGIGKWEFLFFEVLLYYLDGSFCITVNSILLLKVTNLIRSFYEQSLDGYLNQLDFYF